MSFQYFTNLSSSIQWDLASDYIRNLELLKQMFNPYHIVDEAIDTFKTSHQYTLFEETCNFAINKIRSNPYTSPEEHFQTLRGVSELFYLIGMSWSK